MATIIAQQTKLNIAAEFIRDPSARVQDIARKYKVSARSVTRFRDTLEAQAKRLVAKERAHVEAKRYERAGSFRGIDITIHEHGFQGRNGRVELHNMVFDEVGIDAPASELWERCNEAAVENGLRPIAKGTFYAMLSTERSRRGKKGHAA